MLMKHPEETNAKCKHSVKERNPILLHQTMSSCHKQDPCYCFYSPRQVFVRSKHFVQTCYPRQLELVLCMTQMRVAFTHCISVKYGQSMNRKLKCKELSSWQYDGRLANRTTSLQTWETESIPSACHLSLSQIDLMTSNKRRRLGMRWPAAEKKTDVPWTAGLSSHTHSMSKGHT